MPSLNIDVVDFDPNDQMALIARRTYPGHILASSVWSMVDGVIQRLGTASSSSSEPVGIGRLRVVGHGAPGEQWIGNSHNSTNNRQLIGLDRNGALYNRSVLLQLRGRFASDARVELHGCNVGRNGERLRHALRNLWGVPVISNAATQYSDTPGYDYLERR